MRIPRYLAYLLCFFIIAFSKDVCAQANRTKDTKKEKTVERRDKEIYPDRYTFKHAKKLAKRKDFEKAVWFYINLYPEDKEKSIASIKKLATEIPNLPRFIKKTHAAFSPFDPQIYKIHKGKLNIEYKMLKKKLEWADKLAASVSE